MKNNAIAILTIILNFTFSNPLQAQDVQDLYVNVENSSVQRYMSEVTYTSQEDSSQVELYCTNGTTRLDWPNRLVISIPDVIADSIEVSYALESNFSDKVTVAVTQGQQQVTIYNLVPQQSYYYEVVADGNVLKEGRIHTLGQVRMIYAPNVRNIRDIGGWVNADGKRIKYGKMFRGSEMNGQYIADSVDIAILRQLGIEAELDIRAWYNDDSGKSAFGFLSSTEVNADEVPTYLYTNNSGQLPEHLTTYMFLSRWKQEFQFIVNNLRLGRAVYQHCVYGADRTGYLSLFLEGLLGVTYDGLMKDYELTSFSGSLRKKNTIDEVISFIENLNGTTLQDQFNTFFVKRLGVSQDDVNFFLSEMLEENEQISVGIDDKSSSTHHSNVRTYDVWGRERGHENGRGIVIEVTADGHVRKVVR